MRTLQTIQVYAKLNQGLWVGLASVRKNRGHDDSLPYQGTIYIHHQDSVPNTDLPTFQKVGYVWNDGWGGPSNIVEEPAVKDSIKLIQVAAKAATKHQMSYKGEFFGNYNLNDVLDIMAEGFLEIRKKHPHAAQVRYYLDDEKTNPTGTSKYSFPR